MGLKPSKAIVTSSQGATASDVRQSRQRITPDYLLIWLDAIYILCGDQSSHEKWAQIWTKVRGVHTNIKEICQALQLAIKQYDQDSIAVSFLTINEMTSTDNLNQLEPAFMYTQLFKEILLDIEYDPKAIKDLAACCREAFTDNLTELQVINEFEHDYRPQKAIWWYTRECFTYKMLNQALQIMDADIIINMGFFLRDVHQQIQQLYEQQVNSYERKPFIVYRGQGVMKLDFEKLQKAKGGLMSFNNFLSTSTDKEVSLKFAGRAASKPKMVGILFVMSIDPCIKSTPFASITELSYFEAQEQEILFSMHTVFRVNAIKQMDNKNQLYQVELQLTSDDDQQLRLLTDQIREEAGGSTGWQRLGNLLLTIGQFNKAEELYNVLLEQTSDKNEKALYYNQLGCVKYGQGNYKKAIWYSEQGLEIQQKTLPSNHSELTPAYINIGNVYHKMGEYSKSLSFYEQGLAIQQKTLSSNHPLLATSYNNIGFLYNNMGEYSKALSFYEQGLVIKQKTLSSNHPSLATSYTSIGTVYDKMGEYSKALLSHEKALEIRQTTLPSNHPSLATSYSNFGNVYDNMGEYSKALSYYEIAFKIRQKTLPSYHPDFAQSYNNIGLVYKNMGEYSKALSSYEKALKIQEKTFPSNHPDLASSYKNVGNVYYYMKDYSKALSYFDLALNIFQHALPPTHPYIKTVKESIEIVKNKL
ncbi:unnamed protein product [Adineta steineri]|uniref:Kinesin light chain n=1 Tax=Adineta steineri TaxID=433720 RepID=A0A819BXT2_9BILA|nr:unnamed protein product [Adineta steineri]CAF1398809.1 unnamed protein product [Adineta steineri]CAF3803858.1 unnamed protein product [Adineta steineri]CAF4020523.1 unnamed protein product [Adineta steineri]